MPQTRFQNVVFTAIMALIWRLLYCGPLCRLIFRLLFRVPARQTAQAH